MPALRSAVAALAVAVALAGIFTTAPAQAETADQAHQRVLATAGEYWNTHPGDYRGLSAAITAAGGDAPLFTIPDAGLTNVTGEQAQAAYDKALAGDPTIAAIPVDAFTVSGYWLRFASSSSEWWDFNGLWNYRDNFIGSGAPDNGSGIATGGMNYACWRQDGDTVHAASYDNVNYSHLTYRKDASPSTSVWGIRDATSGFKLLTDHGTHTISFKRIGSGCSDGFYGRYYWEHNQGGSGTWTYSINVSAFGISYTTSGGDKLQKSTALIYKP